jgi:hypothetical protein
VSLRSRVNRLERERPDRGRCRACRTRPGHIIKCFRQDSPDAIPIPRATTGDEGQLCTACGWAPVVTEITELVIHTREDVASLRESGVWSPEPAREPECADWSNA